MKGNTKLRQKSIKTVLQVIKNNGPVSKRELQEITGFSWGNISFITAELFNNNYIMVSGKQDTFVGRKPEVFDINFNDNFIIGIDFSSKGVLGVICDLRGRVISKFSELFIEKNYNTAINTLYYVVEHFLNKYKGKNILHIAIAMQGDIDYENGLSIKLKAIDGWENVSVCKLLEERFNIKASMLHDPECLLYTEKNHGILSGAPIENAFILSINNHGCGIAVMLGGKMYLGSKGKTCEISSSFVPYGDNGDFYKIDEILKDKWIKEKYNSTDNISALDIANKARSGEERAKSIFKNIGKSFAFALNNSAILLNPEKIILFGSFCKYSDLFLQSTIEQIEKLSGEGSPSIVVSAFDENSAAVGATLFAADTVINELNFVD